MGLRWRGRPTASRRDYDSEMMSCMSHDFVPREIAMILIHLAFLTSELKLFRSKRITGH